MKPMLAVCAELNEIRYPLLASPKLDGVRALVIDGKLCSRSLKPFPNESVQNAYSKKEFNGLDGELIVGSPTAKDVFRSTSSATANAIGHPVVTFYVFDDFSAAGTFEQRLAVLRDRFLTAEASDPLQPAIVVLEHRLIVNAEQLNAYEQEMLAIGYEGLILRSPRSPYKQGRSTVAEGWMLKLKRFTDSEAKIIGMEEEMANGNEAKRNALGRTERSTAKAGLKGKGQMGALIVCDVHSGVQFNIGTGFTIADRKLFWENRNAVLGMTVKYKSFLVGVKDSPRFPVYLGMRPAHDMSD